MTALTKDTNRTYELGEINEVPVKGGSLIYQGSAVGANNFGYARALQTGDLFLGFAEDNVDNTGNADGVKNIRVRRRGSALLDIASVTLVDINKSVYATDDNTFILTAGGGAAYVGKIVRIDSAGVALVEFIAGLLP